MPRECSIKRNQTVGHPCLNMGEHSFAFRLQVGGAWCAATVANWEAFYD